MSAIDPTPGRLIVITAADAADSTAVGYAVAARLPRAVHVEGGAIHRMVVSGEVPLTEPASREAVEQYFLRLLGSIAVAETYQRAGFDAVISDSISGEFLDDFLDFVSPSPLHLVMLDPAAEDRRLGVSLDTSGQSAVGTANDVLDRLDEALVGSA